MTYSVNDVFPSTPGAQKECVISVPVYEIVPEGKFPAGLTPGLFCPTLQPITRINDMIRHMVYFRIQ